MSEVVPGKMRCVKCNFQLQRQNLYMLSGTVGPGNNETEPCPNGCGPLWPMTWQQEAYELGERLEQLFNESRTDTERSDATIAALRAEVAGLRAALKPFAVIGAAISRSATNKSWLEAPLFYAGTLDDPQSMTLTGRAFEAARAALGEVT